MRKLPALAAVGFERVVVDVRAIVDPRATWGRMASGAFGGLVGGLVSGLFLLGPVVATACEVCERDLGPLVRQATGITSGAAIFLLHAGASILAGVLYGFLAPTRSYRASVLLGLAYGLLVWLVGIQTLLRGLAGAPLLAFDFGAAYSLLGYLAFGITLGAVYKWFHDLEVREALDAKSPRMRRWGRRERGA